jgi:hypothetical protein
MNRRVRIVLWVIFWLVLVGVAGLGLIATVQGARFERMVHRNAHELFGRSSPIPLHKASTLSQLPAPVQRYLELAGAHRREPVKTARLRHRGTLQLAPDARPSAIRGEQYFTADPPGFVWWGRIRLGPGLWIDGRDRSIDGVGNMYVRAVSTFTLADARGPELDEGALQRLLGELCWLPTALLDGRYVRWEPVDDATARAHLTVGGRDVALAFHFGPDGFPATVTAERSRDVGGKSVRTPWQGASSDWREVDGLRVPFRMEASWTIDGKLFTYARWRVEQLEYDVAEPY